MSSGPIDRLAALDNVEKEIASCIQSAGKKSNSLERITSIININN